MTGPTRRQSETTAWPTRRQRQSSSAREFSPRTNLQELVVVPTKENVLLAVAIARVDAASVLQATQQTAGAASQGARMKRRGQRRSKTDPPRRRQGVARAASYDIRVATLQFYHGPHRHLLQWDGRDVHSDCRSDTCEGRRHNATPTLVVTAIPQNRA